MKNTRPGRPQNRGQVVSRTVLSTVRILIASYFVATATGLVFEPGSQMFLDSVLPKNLSQFASTTYLYCTAFAIMVGIAVRPAALLLAIYIFWSGFTQFDLGGDPEALSTFWRDMALLGAVLLIAVTEPGGSTRFRLWAKPVHPRRVARQRLQNRTRSARRIRPVAEAKPVQELVGAELAQAEVAAAPALVEEDEVTNIFADVWEPRPEPKLALA